MADALPKWQDVAASPEFQSADSSQREAMRMGYREKLAELSYLAGGDDASVGAHLKAFDDFSKPGVFQRIKNSLTGQPTAASAAAMGLDAASRTAEMDAARSPAFITPSSGRGRKTGTGSVMDGVSGLPDNARSSRYAPLSAQGLSGLERQVSANPQRAIEQSTGTGVIDRAKRGIAQDMIDQRTVTAHAGLNRTVEQALGLPAKAIPSAEELGTAGADRKPEEDGYFQRVLDVQKTLARSVAEGAGSLARAAVEVPGRVGDYFDSKAAYVGARLYGLDDRQASKVANEIKVVGEEKRRTLIDPAADVGGKILDYLLPISESSKKLMEKDLFSGNILKGEAPQLNPDSSLMQVTLKGYQTLGHMAPIILGGVLSGGMKVAAALGFVLAADEGGSEESKRIRDMPAAAFREIPLYTQYRNEGLDHEQAKLAVSADAGRWASIVQGMIGSLDGLLFPGAGKIAKQSVTKAFLKGAGEQGAQEMAEDFASRTAASVAIGEKLDPERIGKGSYDSVFLGGLTGGPIKAGTTAGQNAQIAADERFDAGIKKGIADKMAATFGPRSEATAQAEEPKKTTEKRTAKAPVTDLPTDAVPVEILRGKPEQKPQESQESQKATDQPASAPTATVAPVATVAVAPEQSATPAKQTETDQPAPGSWVVVDRETGKGVAELFDKKNVDQVNAEKFAVLPAMEYLQKLNANIKATGEAAIPPSQIEAAKPQEQPNATNVPAEPGVQPAGRGDVPAGDNTGAVPAKPDAPASARPAGAVSADVNAEALTDKAAVTSLANEIGWAERGGQMIRAPGSDGTVGTETISRTQWIPKSDFWPNRPKTGGALNEREAQAALTKFERGDFLTKREQRFIQYAKQFAADRDAQQPAASEPTKTLAPVDINEAEFEHWKQTGEPGFGWMPGYGEAIDAVAALSDAELAILDSIDFSRPINEQTITEATGRDSQAEGPAASSGPQDRATGKAEAAQEVGEQSLESRQENMREAWQKWFGDGDATVGQRDYAAEFSAIVERNKHFDEWSDADVQDGEKVLAEYLAARSKTFDTKALDEMRNNEARARAAAPASDPNADKFNRSPERALSDLTDQQLEAVGKAVGQKWKKGTSRTAFIERIGVTNEIRNAYLTILKKYETSSTADRPSLELTGQTENQIRGEEAQRAKQQADQRARDNAPSPDDFTLTGSDRAADVGAARGQNSLFEPQSEYGQRDLFADDVPDSQRANLVERVSSARSDGIDAKTAVNRAEQRTLPGRYATGVKLEPGAVRDSAVASVRNLQDAALATSSLSSLVREHVDVVVTDRAGKILAVQRMFGGATSQASAYPQEIIKFVTAIKGSSAFYVAHNHPSDNYTLSDADRQLSDAIGRLAKGIAPEYRGIVSVTTRGYAGYSADGVDESGPFREAAKKHRIRYLEETVEKRGYLGPVINAPEIAKTVVPEIAQGQQGIVFLDAQYHPTGFFPVNFEDATKLLDGELARDIVAAAYRSRASAAMMATQDYAPGPYVSFATSARDGVRNVGALLARIEVRALDAINSRGDSRAMTGDPIVGDVLFQRSKPAPAPLWRSVLSEAVGKTPFPQAPVDQWKAWLNANAAKLGVKKDEIEWSGITDWLDLQQGKVSREQVQQYLAQNGVKVTETQLGSKLGGAEIVKNGPQDYDVVDGDGNVIESGFMARQSAQEFIDSESKGDTKYSNYTLPGGENYRELLLTLPPKPTGNEAELTSLRAKALELEDRGNLSAAENGELNQIRTRIKSIKDATPKGYKSSHWDQPNILAHIRFNERTDADGKRVLFIEEIQGDWQQEYRKQADAIAKAVDDDFLGIVKRMEADGVLEVVCD